MARVSIDLPSHFRFSTDIPIRITDVNFGGHVGNDTVLSIIHEARMQFLKRFDYSETNFGGTGLIMTDAAIQYKNELFYGDTVRVFVAVADVSKVSFDVVYKLEKETGERTLLVARAKTGMACFDYERRKLTAVPDEVKVKWQ